MFTFRAPALMLPAVLSAILTPTAGITQTDTNSSVPPLQIDVRNVLVDVIVTDKQGAVVPGLKKEDFQIIENGRPQRIEYFEPHFPSAAAPMQAARRLPVNTLYQCAGGPAKRGHSIYC